MTKQYLIPIAEVKVGDKLVADGGFTCLKEGEVVEVKKDGLGLYVDCTYFHHYLDGQEGHTPETEGCYVGFLKEGT